MSPCIIQLRVAKLSTHKPSDLCRGSIENERAPHCTESQASPHQGGDTHGCMTISPDSPRKSTTESGG
ncbi:uncharacterized protein B0I36DRAFT_310789 [Microdochium trichocladiopsis]|uniref:Uncharacterized protein n=1 Tax=Microdochium trichocladiopsis TaxID=1682393 RepID=A0A9P8YEV2_9PEZI|nr:uncharacterized protein B0I36DRAFT_310789 [Microdochium trichocladiopsis]KAH7040487.1 hypothetical protein B0I36DRAFT_310789 [Microdochium trichocladiopsis]